MWTAIASGRSRMFKSLRYARASRSKQRRRELWTSPRLRIVHLLQLGVQILPRHCKTFAVYPFPPSPQTRILTRLRNLRARIPGGDTWVRIGWGARRGWLSFDGRSPDPQRLKNITFSIMYYQAQAYSSLRIPYIRYTSYVYSTKEASACVFRATCMLLPGQRIITPRPLGMTP